jgi:hypothetical protein
MSSEREGKLRNGNPRGNPHASPRCGAHTKAGGTCRQPAMPNGRCRLHGGRSTGPRTAAGRAAVATAHTKHGGYSAEARDFLTAVNDLLRSAPAGERRKVRAPP